MNNPIKEIYKFNKEAGLLENGYNDIRECAYPIEEMLEGFDLTMLDGRLNGDNSREPLTGKAQSRVIMDLVEGTLSDVDRLDKHLDAIIFNFGSIFKLGLTPQQAMNALSVVMHANMQKLKAGQDEMGKQMKPEDFIGPEEALQKILDKRN